MVVLFATALYFSLTLVWSLGTLHPLDRPLHNFCLLDNEIVVRDNNDVNCRPIEFNVHKHDDNLVLNFKNAAGLCRFLCIDKCGNVYHDSVYHTEDCKMTTAAFDGVETLSVHRGNYSDFVATYMYYPMPLSMSDGDALERLHSNVALKFNQIKDKNDSCTLMLTPSKKTRSCSSTSRRLGDYKYNTRRHYRDYTFWGKLMILFGFTKYEIPSESTLLSRTEYNETRT